MHRPAGGAQRQRCRARNEANLSVDVALLSPEPLDHGLGVLGGRDERGTDALEARDNLVECPDLHVAEGAAEELEAAQLVLSE